MSDRASGTPRTVQSALRDLADGSLTAVDLLEEVDAAADAADPLLGIYLHRTPEEALAAAQRVDADRAAGCALGPLAGIPLAIKDIIATRDAPTTAQSRACRPADVDGADAVVVARLRRAGAILTGKTTTMEYAIGFHDPDAGFPEPRNPWDRARWSGGSSSGTAIGIATGAFLGGPGTDTAGSIRNPAAWCGVTGLKPTHGLVPIEGVLPLGPSYDHVGPMARSAQDCRLILAAMTGRGIEPDPCADDATRVLDGLRVGWTKLGLDGPDADPDVAVLFEAALAALHAGGAELREIRLPHYEAGHAATMVGLSAEAFAHHRAALAERWADYGRPARLAIAHGAFVSAADLLEARRVRAVVGRDLATLFAEIDVVLTPTTTRPAPRLDDLDFDQVVGSLCSPYWNASGCPVLSVPIGRTRDGLPAGMQVCGPRGGDDLALSVGAAYQHLTAHHLALAPVPEATPHG